MPERTEGCTIDRGDRAVGLTFSASGWHGPSEARSRGGVGEMQQVKVLGNLTTGIEERSLVVGAQGLGDGVVDASVMAGCERSGDEVGPGGIPTGHKYQGGGALVARGRDDFQRAPT
jgi:hypothetical protein